VIDESEIGRPAGELLAQMGNDVEDHILSKYSERRPKKEAQSDSLLFAVIHYSNYKFSPNNNPEIKARELPKWEKAISDAITGNWEAIRDALNDSAATAFQVSKMFIEERETVDRAAALHILAQSL